MFLYLQKVIHGMHYIYYIINRDSKVCWSSTFFKTDISQQILNDSMIFCTDIHGTHKKKLTYFGDPLVFPLVPPAG